jgi:hypothetical protein
MEGAPPATVSARAVRLTRPRVAARMVDRLETDQLCSVALGGAMALSVALSLWLTRGTTFHLDEFLYYVENQGVDLHVLLAPQNGHLIFFPRLIYAVLFDLFGSRHYVVWRLVEALGIALVAGLFFRLAKRRVGAPAALAPSVLLLFLGSAWPTSLDPAGITHVYCLAAGLGALLTLERRSSSGDLTACGLLVVAVGTFSTGLAFVVGVAVSVMLRPERWRRAWIFVVPLVLYGIWILAPKLDTPPFSTGTGAKLSNALLIPNYAADAASAVAAAVSGLSYDFANAASSMIDSPFGYVIVAAVAAALVYRLRGGRPPFSLWTSLAVLVSYWAGTALVTSASRTPNQNRYVYDAAVISLLVVADALRGVRPSRRALVVVFAVLAVSILGNIALLRVGAREIRASAASDRAELAAVEIARDRVSPYFIPQAEPQLKRLDTVAGGARPYLAAVDRNGSFAFTVAELRRQPEPVRELADSTLVAALRINLAPLPAAPAPAAARCQRIPSRSGGVDLPAHAPGVLLRADLARPVTMRRFGAAAGARVGTLPATGYAALRISPDRAPDVWHIDVEVTSLTVCALTG